jgi:release factor glutamine methyltransferase
VTTPTTIGEALLQARKRLSPTSSTAQLDAEVLLAHLLGTNRSSLLAHASDPVSSEQLSRFERLVESRTKGEPVAYLTGHKEFFGLDLLVTRDVLVPRPETESVVEACLEHLPQDEVSQVADIGTGSGAILVAVLANRSLARGYGVELSPEALEVARQNCVQNNVADRANLPYVSPDEAEPDVAKWEPRVAVFGGGQDGADTIRRFLGDAPRYLLPGGVVVMETAYSQGPLVAQLAKTAFPAAEIEVRKDLAGLDRIVVINTK